ncbi:MAG: cell division topological specificity factor MinE [Chloroflexota bacterium]
MGFFDRIFRKEEASASVAKNRLQMVLVHDRNDISPGMIDMIKDDIIAVLVHHLGIDATEVDVQLGDGDTQNVLVAQVPLHSTRQFS